MKAIEELLDLESQIDDVLLRVRKKEITIPQGRNIIRMIMPLYISALLKYGQDKELIDVTSNQGLLKISLI